MRKNKSTDFFMATLWTAIIMMLFGLLCFIVSDKTKDDNTTHNIMVGLSIGCLVLSIVLLVAFSIIRTLGVQREARLLTEFDEYAFDELFSIGDTKKRNPNVTHYRNIEFGGFIKGSDTVLLSNHFIGEPNFVLLSDDGPIELEVPAQMIAKCSKLKMKTLVSVVVESNDGVNRCKGILFLDGLFSWWLKDGSASDENTNKN